MSLGRFNYKRKYCDLCRNLSPSQNIGYTYTYRRDARNKFIINLRRRAEVNSRRATVTARATSRGTSSDTTSSNMELLLVLLALLASATCRSMPADYVPTEEQLLEIFGDLLSNTSTTPVGDFLKNKKGSNVIHADTPATVEIGSRINTKICVNINNSTEGGAASNGTKSRGGQECVDDRVLIDASVCLEPAVRVGDVCVKKD